MQLQRSLKLGEVLQAQGDGVDVAGSDRSPAVGRPEFVVAQDEAAPVVAENAKVAAGSQGYDVREVSRHGAGAFPPSHGAQMGAGDAGKQLDGEPVRGEGFGIDPATLPLDV